MLAGVLTAILDRRSLGQPTGNQTRCTGFRDRSARPRRCQTRSPRNVSNQEPNEPTNMTKDLGTRLLAVWLIILGLTPYLNLNIAWLATATNILAIAAGVLILLGR